MIDKKLLIKAIIYRVLAFIFIFTMCMILTKEMYVSILAGIAEFVFKILLYYIYEIAWKKFANLIVIKKR